MLCKCNIQARDEYKREKKGAESIGSISITTVKRHILNFTVVKEEFMRLLLSESQRENIPNRVKIVLTLHFSVSSTKTGRMNKYSNGIVIVGP